MPDLPTSGSPPLVRGKEDVQFEEFFDAGITPACAGKSICAAFPSCYGRDHPRLRGEKYAASSTGAFSRGSPPLVRGKALTICPPL